MDASLDTSPQALQEGLQRTRLRLHASVTPSALIVSPCVAGVVLVLGRPEVPTPLQVAWCMCLLAALVLRAVVWRAHVAAFNPGSGLAAAQPCAATVALWLRRYRLAYFGHGMAWGLAAALMPPLMNADGQTQLIFAFAALVAGGLIAAAFDLPAAALFVAPTLLPMVWHQLLRGDAQGGTQGVLLLFLAVAGGSTLRLQHIMRNGVRLRLDHARHAAAAQRHLLEAEAARQALAEQHHLMAQLLRTTRQGYWRLDSAGVTVDVNPAMCVLMGRPREQVIGRPVLEFFNEENRRIVEREIASRRTGVSGSYEVALLRPDGSQLHCMNQASPMEDSAGVHMGSVGLWTDISVRRQAELVLRSFELVVNSITDLVSVVDERRVYRLVNDAWCAMAGLTREQVLGRTTDELLPGGGGAARSRALGECLQTQQVLSVRDPLSPTSSPGQMFETTYYPYASHRPGERLVVMVSRDVSGQEASRRALEASAEYLRHTLNATGDAIFASDALSPGEPVRFVNARMLQLFGIPEPMAERLTPADIMSHALPMMAEPDLEVRLIQDVIARNLRHESQVRLRDGRVLLRRCEPAQVGAQNLRVWSFRDITAEQRALQSLQHRDAEQRALLDAFPGHIAALDEQQRYTYVNDRVARVLGVQAASLIGRSVGDVLGPERAHQVGQCVARARAGEVVVELRSFVLGADQGGRLDLDLNYVLGPAAGGGQQTCYIFGVDITARRRAETLLISARDEAERANLAKSQFLSQMSHELRTPMNAILGFGQLLESDTRQALAPHQQRWVREILRGARHLLDLINEVLDLGRIESGHLQVRLTEVELGDLVAQSLELVRPLAPVQGIQLQADAAHLAGVSVVADGTRLKQVLLNLLGNAIKYNRAGGEVRVGCEQEPGHVRLLVRDTGPGLSAADQERLFQPFERLHAATSGVEGTGIGLVLSRRLVEAMGGTIGLHSQVGVGSTFWVRLPRAAQASPAGAEAVAALHPPVPVAAPKGTVLYIEDNPVNLALMDAMLSRLHGVHLHVAMAPAEGLRMAFEQRPSLVLLDIQLPGMDGFEVLSRLRADERTRQIPVIAVSANAMPSDIEAAQAAGFAGYLTKPLDLGLLLRSVQAALLGDSPPCAR